MAELNFTNPPGNAPTMVIDDNKNRDFMRFFKAGTENFRITKTGQIVSTAGCKYKYLTVGLWDLAADSDALSFPLMRLSMPVTLESIVIACDSNVTLHASNYQTIAAKDADGNTIGSITTQTTGFTANTFRSIGTLNATHKLLIANEGIKLTLTKTGTGVAMSGVVVMICFQIDKTYNNTNTSSDTDPPVVEFVNSPDASEVILSDRALGDHVVLKNNGVEVFNVNVDGKIKTTSVDQFHFLTMNVGDITASGPTPATFALLKPSAKIKVHAVWIGADTSLALSDDSNYLTLSFLGAGGTTICTCTTTGPNASGTALTLGTLTKIADINDGNINEQNAEVASTDTLKLSLAKTGTGGTNLSGLTIQVKYEKLA